MRILIFPLNLLPVPVINKIATATGWLAWIIYPFRLNVAYSNLSTVFPNMEHGEKLRLLREVYLQLARTICLILILHRKPIFKLVQEANVSGLEVLDEALKKGQGVILTTYHGFWFEAYFAWFNSNHRPTSLIYQEQSNPLSDSFFRKQRSRYGDSLEHIQSNAGLKRYQQALDENRIVIISLDQNYKYTGSEIQLFNKTYKCAKGSAILHLRTGAPVLASVYYMKDNKLHIDIDEIKLPSLAPVENMSIEEETISLISTTAVRWYEPYIEKYPEQWFSLFHRLWSKSGYPERIRRTIGEIFR